MNPLILLKLWTFSIFCKGRVNLWAELCISFAPVSLFLCLFLSFLAFSLTLTLLWLLFSAPLECAGVLMPYWVRTLCWAVGFSQQRCFLFTLYLALLWVQPSAETKRSSTGPGVHPSARTNRNESIPRLHMLCMFVLGSCQRGEGE